MPIPLLDLKLQYATIRDEVLRVTEEVYESQYFILGKRVDDFERDFAAYCQTKHATGVSSGTDALLVALMVLDIKAGDEVIVPAYSFFATAGVVHRTGATPVFVDIDLADYNIDPRQIERKITKRTKAILPVHLYGHPADMAPLMEIARKHGLRVIEDCAQSFGAEYRGKKTGAIGDLGCFSFFPSKNLGCYGDGGMVITDDAKLAEKLQSLRNHGSRVRYYHDEVGYNSRLDELQAAVLNVKFRHIDAYNEGRRKNASLYAKHLSGTGVLVPSEQKDCKHVFHQYTVRIKDRDAVKKKLDDAKMSSMIYYPVPCHLQAAYRDLGMKPGSLPVAERTAQEVLSLPMYPELTEEQVRTVADAVKGAM